MDLKIFADKPTFVTAGVDAITSICETIDNSTIALSGGSTPRPVYEALATQKNLPWSQIIFFQTDERYVPANDPNSNRAMIQQTLLQAHQPKACHFFDTTLPLDECLDRYEAALYPFDLCILGIGPDGHIASLFPHSAALEEDEHLVAHTTTDMFPVHDRLTITFPAILASKKIILLLGGKEKKAILDDLLYSKKSIDELPAKKLLEHPYLTIHFLKI